MDHRKMPTGNEMGMYIRLIERQDETRATVMYSYKKGCQIDKASTRATVMYSYMRGMLNTAGNNVNVYRLNSENSFMKNKLTLNQNGSNKPQKKCQPISGLDKFHAQNCTEATKVFVLWFKVLHLNAFDLKWLTHYN